MHKRPVTFRDFPCRSPACPRRILFPGNRAKGHVGEFMCVVFLSFLPFPSSLPQSAASPEVAAACMREGVQALFAGDYTKAESAARQQLQLDSRSVDALVLLARAQMARGKYPLAFSSLREALDYSPDHVEALYFMGKLTSALSQMEYQQLAQLAPNSGRVRQLMGDSYQAAGDLGKAQDEYRAALLLQPDLLDVALEVAEILRTQGRFDEALKFYSQILERNPRHFPSLYGAGLCHQALQHDDQCIEFFELAARSDPKDAVCRLALGAAFMRKGEPAKAVEALSAAVRLDPLLREAYSLLGGALRMTGQPEQAAQAFEKARLLLKQELESRQERAIKAINAPVKN